MKAVLWKRKRFTIRRVLECQIRNTGFEDARLIGNNLREEAFTVSLRNGMVSKRSNFLDIRLGAIESFDEFLVPILEGLEKKIPAAEEKLANKKSWKYPQKRRIDKMREHAGQIRVIGHVLRRNPSQGGCKTALAAIDKLLRDTKSIETRNPKAEKLSPGIALVKDHIKLLATR